MFDAFIPRFKANSNSLNRKIKLNKFFTIKYSSLNVMKSQVTKFKVRK